MIFTPHKSSHQIGLKKCYTGRTWYVSYQFLLIPFGNVGARLALARAAVLCSNGFDIIYWHATNKVQVSWPDQATIEQRKWHNHRKRAIYESQGSCLSITKGYTWARWHMGRSWLRIGCLHSGTC